METLPRPQMALETTILSGLGAGANGNKSWDQFSANVKASFEDVYTTKLDQSAPDFKEANEKPNVLLMKLSEVLPTTPTLQKNEGSILMTVASTRKANMGLSFEVGMFLLVLVKLVLVPPPRR